MIVNGHWGRWFSCWFSDAFWILVTYRVSRSGFLFFGEAWKGLRVIFAPATFILRPWIGRHEIHYEAEIGIGLKILHPSLGCVISRYAVIGENFLLVGGGGVGTRNNSQDGPFVIGNNVSLGMGASIIGPVRIGNNVSIGAGAVVIHDVDDRKSVAGVPARIVGSMPQDDDDQEIFDFARNDTDPQPLYVNQSDSRKWR
ncbi:MAG: serine acetyltransferase [Verrucomicrobiae bacterium]|nr:serine acetyltransferase [Verrucomicrobiae bacterium]